MYNQIWKKYLPVVRILLKKSDAEPQTLDLNKIDFERASTRKTGFRFKIDLHNGKVSNILSGSAPAQQLAQVLLDDEPAREILADNDYEINMNTKYQLSIKKMD